jgi:hypothetical protein
MIAKKSNTNTSGTWSFVVGQKNTQEAYTRYVCDLARYYRLRGQCDSPRSFGLFRNQYPLRGTAGQVLPNPPVRAAWSRSTLISSLLHCARGPGCVGRRRSLRRRSGRWRSGVPFATTCRAAVATCLPAIGRWNLTGLSCGYFSVRDGSVHHSEGIS